jgi:hypothetical protein
MTTFVLFLMGAFFMWRVVLYLWCDHCGQNVRNGRSRLCAKCQADLEVKLERLLDK